MRTQDEILQRIRDRAHLDPLGFETDMYIPYLGYERAKEFLNEGVTEEQYLESVKEYEDVVAVMKDYMPFAFNKAHNQRGISAYRSLQHYIAWTWIAGDDKLSAKLDEGPTDTYGLDLLRAICNHYGWNPKELGDD